MNRSTPVQIYNAFGQMVTSIAAGALHSVATCSDGTQIFWGSNLLGQSSLPSTGQNLACSAPVQVPANGSASGERMVGVFSGPASNHSLELVASPPPLLVTTQYAVDLGTGVLLTGSINGGFYNGFVPIFFEYGFTTDYGSTAPYLTSYPYPINAWSPQVTLTGLAPGTYHFRLDAGSYSGQDMTFTTLSLLQNWRQQYFGTTANSGTTADAADYDNDGIPNLIEWACNLDPTTRNVLPATVTANGTSFAYTYSRSTAAANAGTSFSVEWTNTLAAGSWSSSGVVQTVLSDDGTTQQVQAVIPITTESAKFVHLSVTAPP